MKLGVRVTLMLFSYRTVIYERGWFSIRGSGISSFFSLNFVLFFHLALGQLSVAFVFFSLPTCLAGYMIYLLSN